MGRLKRERGRRARAGSEAAKDGLPPWRAATSANRSSPAQPMGRGERCLGVPRVIRSRCRLLLPDAAVYRFPQQVRVSQMPGRLLDQI